MNNLLSKKEKKELEQGLHSIPMVIITKLKKQINLMLILNLILTVGFCVSVYNSIKVRNNYWDEHTKSVVEALRSHCENELWQN